MKKIYTTPALTVHGTMEDMTQHFGSSSATDVIYIGPGYEIPGKGGSTDGIVVPKLP